MDAYDRLMQRIKAMQADAAAKYPKPTTVPTHTAISILEGEKTTATDGCIVDLQGICEHGHCSWHIMLGLVADPNAK